MAKQIEYNATVSQRLDVAPGLAIFRIVPDGPLFDFKAGQYTVLGLHRKEARYADADAELEISIKRDPEELIRRAYSIASSSLEREYIEFYIILVKSGELTPRLFNLKVGDRLFLGPKATGMFTLDKVPEGKNVLLAATGTGLAPYISMVRTQLSEHRERKFVVMHGAAHSWDLAYRDELKTLCRYFPNLSYIPTISDAHEDRTWKGHTGWVQHLLEDGTVEKESGSSIHPEAYDVFLCGNPGMVEDMMRILGERGFTKDERNNPGTIHIEEYW